MDTLRRIWEAYPVVQAVMQSLVATLWLWGGLDELRKGRKGSSLVWVFISAFILVMTIVDHSRGRQWGAALVAAAVAATETLFVLKRWGASEDRAESS